MRGAIEPNVGQGFNYADALPVEAPPLAVGDLIMGLAQNAGRNVLALADHCEKFDAAALHLVLIAALAGIAGVRGRRPARWGSDLSDLE